MADRDRDRDRDGLLQAYRDALIAERGAWAAARAVCASDAPPTDVATRTKLVAEHGAAASALRDMRNKALQGGVSRSDVDAVRAQLDALLTE